VGSACRTKRKKKSGNYRFAKRSSKVVVVYLLWRQPAPHLQAALSLSCNMSEAQAKKPSLEDFELGEPLGRGAYGDVRLNASGYAQNLTNMKYDRFCWRPKSLTVKNLL
jgi:hypothetical protein